MVHRVTTSDNEWQRVVQRMTTNDNAWYSEWQSDNEWQQRVTTNGNEWQRVRVVVQRMKTAQYTSKNGWLPSVQWQKEIHYYFKGWMAAMRVVVVVNCCTTRCHSLSLVATRCTTHCHSLSLDVFIYLHFISSWQSLIIHYNRYKN